MMDEFKFRALTNEDWKEGILENLIVESGLKLREDEKEGTYTSQLLDSGINGCRWHRVVLDATIPENTTIRISFCTTEREVGQGWVGAIVFGNARDALIPLERVLPGQYIQLQIKFFRRDIKSQSPVLRQVKIFYPRISYLRYLPEIYSEDKAAKDFLERFLSVFESLLFDSEDAISRIHKYFDPKAAPDDFVHWLANWVSLDLYELLGDKNREFILRAIEFYNQKGTVSGIARLVSFLTGKKCCVKEYMNNVFHSWGMVRKDMESEKEEINGYQCTKFCGRISRAVNTEYPGFLHLKKNMGDYEDELHYVTGTSKTGTTYSRNAIGLFIYINSPEQEFRIRDELYKILDTFLPVFVTVQIRVIEEVEYYEAYSLDSIIDEHKERIHVIVEEEFDNVQGTYMDKVNCSWLISYYHTHRGYTNDLQYRTPHSQIDVVLQL